MDNRAARRTRGSWLREIWQSWILLNVSWSSKWWYATVHNITAIVGSGVLSLPSAMAFLGWELGTLSLIWFIVFSQICYWQLIQMHEMVRGRRFDRYHELGQYVLGEKLGFWLIVPLQALVEIGVDTIYLIIGATSLKKVYETLCGNESCTDFRLYQWMIVFFLVQLLLSQLPHFPSITWVSVMAAATAVGYSTLSWIAILLQSRDKLPPGLNADHFPPGKFKPDYDYPKGSASEVVFGIFTALGKIAFSTAAGHNIALEVQATIPSTPERPSKVAMWNGVFVTYVVITFCYLPVALTGYQLYGNVTVKSCLRGNRLKDCHLLLYLNHPRWMIVLANIMVVIHMCGSYQVYAMPLFNLVEFSLENKFRIQITFLVRSFLRTIYVGITFVLGATLPFFGDLEALIGGIAIIPTTYLLPCILWKIAKKPRKYSLSWLGNTACIVIGVILMIIMTVGGLRNLIHNGKTYKFFTQ